MSLPRFILSNPFRILGIPADSTERVIIESLARLNAFARVGKQLSQPLDFPLLFGKTERTMSLLEKCNSLTYNTPLRLKHALVWFSISTPQDLYALDFIKRGDLNAARDILHSETVSFSAMINCAVIDFIKGNSDTAVRTVLSVIRSEKLRKDFLASVSSDIVLDEPDLLKIFIDHISESFSIDNLALWLNGYELAEMILYESYFNRCKNEIEANLIVIETSAQKSMESLSEAVARIISVFERLQEKMPDTDNPAIDLLHDKVARTILDKSISVYNSGAPVATGRGLLKLIRDAYNISCTPSIKALCKENYNLLLNNINQS